jgi:hypothetical protein
MDDALLDEAAVRDLLGLVATDEAPPSRIDVDFARRQGRRRRRLRRVYLPGAAPLAAAAAVALIAGLTASLSGPGVPSHKPPASRGGRTAQIAAPRQFSLLYPYASLGWLPAGFSAAGPDNQMSQSATELDVTATAPASDGRALMLRVDAASCRVTGNGAQAYVRTRDQYPHASDCFGDPLSSRAPDVNGAPAYWTALHGSLVWEYGRNAWAILNPMPNPAICVHCAPHPRLTGWYYVAPKNGHPAVPQSAAARQLLLKIASAVRFGTKPAVYYGFTLSSLPPSWRPFRAGDISNFGSIDGRLVSEGWSAGPADDPEALGISVWPATPGSHPCKYFAGQSSYLTLDGARALLRTIDEPDKHVQVLCAPDFRGLQVSISLDQNVPGTSDRPLPDAGKVGGVVSVFQHVHLYGGDVASWPAQLP